ncbi:hypothetical protein [Curtobacterium flaccumfaciens]|uniref:hypothetical protein n=1 Tax=Curtobacterium flaccumfaciens TaxID=2035 RepID=UPI00399515E1
MPNQEEVNAAKRAAQLALFKRLETAAAPNAQLGFPQLESLARAFRYVAGGVQPSTPGKEE